MPAYISVKDSGNNTVNVATIDATTNFDYETVAQSQSNQVMGSTGAVGDLLHHILIIPGNTSPGAVAVYDNGILLNVFPGGANSVNTLAPINVPLGILSSNGAWKITTGSNVSVIAVGLFT